LDDSLTSLIRSVIACGAAEVTTARITSRQAMRIALTNIFETMLKEIRNKNQNSWHLQPTKDSVTY